MLEGWICIGFILRKAVAQIPPSCPSSGSWLGTGQVNTAQAASPLGTLQGKTVLLVNPRLGFKWLSGFAAG